MDDLICRGALILVIAVIAFGIYRWKFTWTYTEDPPVVFDARRDESQIIEAGSIIEQRRYGRERGGPVTVIIDREPGDYSAQLNLRSLRNQEKKGLVKIEERDNET